MKSISAKSVLSIFVLAFISGTLSVNAAESVNNSKSGDTIKENSPEFANIANQKSASKETSDNMGTLDSLEITAYRFGADSLSVPANSQIIDRKDIEESASATISEVLKKKGNVRFMSFTGTDAEGNIAMRGFGENSQSRILVLVDGIKYNSSDSSSVNWTQIPIMSVESIEVIRGAQSAIYGGNAEAGVIKISTIRDSDGYDAYFNGMYGSYGLYNVSATGVGREGDFSFGANVSRYNSDGYRERSSAWSNYAAAWTGYDISEKSRIIVKGDFCESFVEYPNSLDWDTFQNNPRSATYSTGYKNQAGIYTANLETTTDTLKSDTTFGINFRDRIIDANTTNNQWTYTFSPRFEITKFDDLKIFGGIDCDYGNIDFNKDAYLRTVKYNAAASNVDRCDIGGYAGAHYNLSDDIILTCAGRGEGSYTSVDCIERKWTNPNRPIATTLQYSDGYWLGGLAGNLGATYKLDDESSIYARFDQIYHYPTTDEIAAYQGYGADTFTFNKDLKPEEGQNYEVGYKFINDNWTATASTFATRLDNEIQWDDTRKMNVNLSPTIRYGVDFSAAYDDEYWGASLSGMFVDARFDGGKWNGNKVPLVAPFNSIATIYAKPLEFVTTLMRFTYYTKQTMGNDYENVYRNIPSYYTIDFQVNVAFTKNFTLFGAVENVTNENYAAFAYSGGYYPNAGRTFKIGVNIKL